ncbi:MAG TPA: membrane protein insertion efficiency factor YidD [Candidatus Binataceae bacterium]|nr:membrane protein insertion efficiency factor YidD [Candidatus Binataceae bacterium]
MDDPPRNRCVKALTLHALQSISTLALAMITVYRAVLSPVLVSTLGPACRFEPSCSVYATEAIARYGIGQGGWMALKRLIKCRPFGGWGFDPLPPTLLDNQARAGGAQSPPQ